MMQQQVRAEAWQPAVNYIVYILDGLGRIQGAEWIAAADDADALEQAQRIAGPSRCELWQRTRRVAQEG